MCARGPDGESEVGGQLVCLFVKGSGVPGAFIWPWWWVCARQPDGSSKVGEVGRQLVHPFVQGCGCRVVRCLVHSFD